MTLITGAPLEDSAVGRTGWPRLASTEHETSRCPNELA